MKVTQEIWDHLQGHLGYSEEEMKTFRDNPKNEEILSKTDVIMSKTIVFEVIKSHGCNCKHMVGDRFVFDASGILLTKLNQKKLCIYALSSLATLIFTASEFIYAGIDPNTIKFSEIGCPDVGVNCGGWGHIVMKLKVEDRK